MSTSAEPEQPLLRVDFSEHRTDRAPCSTCWAHPIAFEDLERWARNLAAADPPAASNGLHIASRYEQGPGDQVSGLSACAREDQIGSHRLPALAAAYKVVIKRSSSGSP